MLKKLGFFMLCGLLFLSLTGCTMVHFVKAESYINSEQYDKAISECKEALRANAGSNPLTLPINGVSVNVDYLSSLCLGFSYAMAGDFEQSKKYYLMSVDLFPDMAYASYTWLASLHYEYGKLEDAYEYSMKAVELTKRSSFDKLESKGHYDRDVTKNQLIAASEYYKLMLSFREMEKEYELKNYNKAAQLAGEILNKKYHVTFGVEAAGPGTTKLSRVYNGTIADLNGLAKGDKVLEINGISVSKEWDMANAWDKVINRYGDTIKIKIERKDRVIEIACKLIYPELEQTQWMLQEAKAKMGTTPAVAEGRDKQAPWIKILEPKSARGIKITAKQNVTFVILASDNVAVKDVLVNNVSCFSAEASILEKTFLPGDVKKYTATIPLTQAKNIFTVKAVDINGNAAQQQIEIEGNASVTKEIEKIYDHRIAVVIGINKYNPWPGLEFAVNDAKAIRDKLSKMGYDKIIELYDREATRARIMRILADELPGTMGKNDSLMVYFAGHGATEDLSGGDQEGYIIPVDGDVKNYRGTAISMTSIHEMIKKYRAKHILFVFDSCYSGLGLKRGGGSIKTASGFIKVMAQKRVTQIITAGGKDEQAAEEKGHGVFTRALLDALDGKDGLNKDGYILASDMGQTIRRKVSEKTNSRQTPLFGWIAGEGDFIFESF